MNTHCHPVRLLARSIALAGLFIAGLATADERAVGFWKTIDDETNKPKGLIQLTIEEGELVGRIVGTFREDGDIDRPCDTCPENLKGRPYRNLPIVWGLKYDDNAWRDGRIVDPEKGKEYGCRIEVAGDDALNVRGYIGTPMLGRTQNWYRATEDEITQATQ